VSEAEKIERLERMCQEYLASARRAKAQRDRLARDARSLADELNALHRSKLVNTDALILLDRLRTALASMEGDK
jgi:hypothetical protein